MIDNRLRNIDFVNGIRGGDINYNFKTIDDAIARERLRAAGMGIVEGFALSSPSQFVVGVGEGVLVSDQGKELFVAATEIATEPPVTIDCVETVAVNEQGEFVLKFRPYSSLKVGCLTDEWYQSHYPIDAEFLIVDAENIATRIKAVRIFENTITLNAAKWAGQNVRVSYKYTQNSMDSLMLNRSTSQYRLEKGITSTSPSHVDIVDYPEWLAIGLVELIVGDNVEVRLSEGYRGLRKVYVNGHNVLYLNGKPYREQPFIHFIEPEEPYENALWYSHQENFLYIWKQMDGDWGWVIVNDASVVPYRAVIMFSPEECPEDLQTFYWPEDRTDMRYIPNINSLEILIDNIPLMSDQIEEITTAKDKTYLTVGVGFKLKDKLERATHVEVRALHCVRSAPLRETFQRAAVFVKENFVFHHAFNTAQSFETDIPYVIGENQLSVFVNGLRLEPEIDYQELTPGGNIAILADKGVMTTQFKVIKALEAGDRVSHRIERWVWSFDHLDQLVHEIEDTADDAKAKALATKTELDNFAMNTELEIADLRDDIADLDGRTQDMDQYIKNDAVLTIDNLDSNVRAGLVGIPVYLSKPAGATATLNGLKRTDFVQVFYQSAAQSRILVADSEYSLNGDGDSCILVLSNDLVSSEASLYITGIHFGR